MHALAQPSISCTQSLNLPRLALPSCASRVQGLRGSIPPNFPYLHVEFGVSDGFVHVIDDEQKFDRNLARNVMIGGWWHWLVGGG